MQIKLFSLFSKPFLFSIFLFISIHVSAQATKDKGWDAFLNNNIAEAQQHFKASLNIAEEKENALLGLAFTSIYSSKETESFDYFNQFYKISKNPSPYVYVLWSTPIINNGDPKKSPEELLFYKSIIERSDFDGSLKAMAYGALGHHFQELKLEKESKEAYKNIGSIERWQILGEFENISTSGFDKNYAALEHPLNDTDFFNKRGARVKWYTPPFYRRDKWVDFTNYFPANSAIVFAQSYVESAEAKEVQLRVGVSGSLKVWINDFLVISEEEERNNDLDNYIRNIKLNKGFNRILVQVGESYAGRSNFLLRLTDRSGNPLTGLNSTPEFKTYEKASAYEVEKVPLYAEAYFESLNANGATHIGNQLLQALGYLRNDKTYESRKILETLKRSYPKSTYLNSLFIELFNRTGNRTGLESTQESIKMNDPEHPLAVGLQYEFYSSKKDFVKMDEYNQKMEKLYGPKNKVVLANKILLSANKGEVDKLVPLVENAYDLYPNHYRFVEYKHLVEKEIKKNNDQAINVLKKYLKTNDSYAASKYLSDLYISLGQLEKGIDVLLEESNADPVAIGVYLDIVRNYYQVQNYTKAKEFENKAIALAPFTDAYHFDLARINKSLKNKEESIASYQKVLELNPNNYGAIKELRELQDKKPLFDYFEKADINTIVSNSPNQESYPNDNSVILHEEVQTIIYPSGGSEERHMMVAKILNTNGIESWKEYTVSASGRQMYIIENAEVIKANGQKVPGEVNNQDIVFTNLEVGDAIHVTYKIENYSQGQLANKFWDTFYFSHNYPYKKTKYSLLVAKNLPFKHQFSQTPLVPRKTTVEDFDLYVFTHENQASLIYEDGMPSLNDVANILHMTTIPDWQYVSNWYNDMASAKARPNYEVKETIKSLFKHKSNLSDKQKAIAIYNFITKNINYSSVSFRQSGLVPQEPATVLNTLIGDCKDVSTLFVSMCKEVGLDANLVLVNTRDNGMKSMLLPSINFNHCIAKLKLEDKDYYLELTSPYLPFGAQYNSSLSSIILDIDNYKTEKTLKYLNPETRKANEIVRNVNIKINNADMDIKEANYKVSSPAASVRKTYSELSEKDRNKTMLDIIKDSSPNAQLKSLSFINLENGDQRDSVFTSYQYVLKDDIKSIGGLQIISLPWSNKTLASDINVTEERKFPIDFTNIYNIDLEKETITVELPEGKSVIENIPTVKYSNDFIDYHLIARVEKNKLIFDRSFKIKKDLIPVNDIPAFMDLYNKIVLSDSKQIAIK